MWILCGFFSEVYRCYFHISWYNREENLFMPFQWCKICNHVTISQKKRYPVFYDSISIFNFEQFYLHRFKCSLASIHYVLWSSMNRAKINFVKMSEGKLRVMRVASYCELRVVHFSFTSLSCHHIIFMASLGCSYQCTWAKWTPSPMKNVWFSSKITV